MHTYRHRKTLAAADVVLSWNLIGQEYCRRLRVALGVSEMGMLSNDDSSPAETASSSKFSPWKPFLTFIGRLAGTNSQLWGLP